MLQKRHIGTEHEGDGAGGSDQEKPQIGARKRRIEARQQEDAGLHHGRRMQIGAHRCRRGHGIGQPEMKRKLRRFGEGPQQEQAQHHRVARIGANAAAAQQNVRKRETPRNLPQQDQPGQQAKPATPRHRKRHAGGNPPLLLGEFVGDQQERRQAGDLPEHQHEDDVLRQNHPQHPAGKGQQIQVKTPQPVLFRHIIIGIENDQQPDAVNQQHEQQRQPIEAQRQIQPPQRQPGR